MPTTLENVRTYEQALTRMFSKNDDDTLSVMKALLLWLTQYVREQHTAEDAPSGEPQYPEGDGNCEVCGIREARDKLDVCGVCREKLEGADFTRWMK
jgi:hypothetical protein